MNPRQLRGRPDDAHAARKRRQWTDEIVPSRQLNRPTGGDCLLEAGRIIRAGRHSHLQGLASDAARRLRTASDSTRIRRRPG